MQLTNLTHFPRQGPGRPPSTLASLLDVTADGLSNLDWDREELTLIAQAAQDMALIASDADAGDQAKRRAYRALLALRRLARGDLAENTRHTAQVVRLRRVNAVLDGIHG